MSEIKRIGVLTGGGDCSGLNAVVRAVTLTAINKYGCEVIGFKKGYAGLYANDYMELTVENTEKILNQGGTILRNSNKDNLFNYAYRDENGNIQHKDVSDVAVENLKKLNIDALVVIGGDGTLTSARDFARKGVKVIGVPKTIDNDVLYVDHTFGFTTALGVICNAIDRVRTTAYSHDRVQILEVMGRNCGWLALEGGLSGGADIILLPEIPYDIYKIVDVIKKRDEAGHFDTVIVVSEGAKPKDGNVVIKKIVADSADTIRLGGIGDQLSSQLEVLLGGKEVRATNIGHTQRGGETCQFDRSLCTKFGSLAVDALFEGKSGEMVTIYNSVPQTVSLELVLGSGATGETSKGGKNSVDPNGFVVKTARNVGISFGD
ncbi:MAG: ATP-dependent 6-phosphofructokinase [Bacilli bacterium]|nr:ATP-dependent 6-phosphofructokinase [Bacilli bacterium]